MAIAPVPNSPMGKSAMPSVVSHERSSMWEVFLFMTAPNDSNALLMLRPPVRPIATDCNASAISTTSKKELIIKRGHKVSKVEDFPIIITNQIEKIKKAKNFRELLKKIGLEEELTRIKDGTKKRSGKSALIQSCPNRNDELIFLYISKLKFF